MFSGYVIVISLVNPNIAPADKTHYSWTERIKSIPLLAPVVVLVFIVLGSIYMGWATPTEAAAVGVTGALLFAFLTRSLNWTAFKTALMGSVKTSCMIMAIVCGAAYLSVAVGYLGITQSLTQYVASLGLSPYILILVLSIMYLGLGCLVDGFSMIVMSTPIALPLVKTVGFDPLWFGIYLVLMIQLAQITPPVGFNLFVINNLTNDELWTIAKATFPFFIILCIGTALITIFPQITLYLPNLMIG
jgi:C4-dicarboxylate transporter, DctM subunit